MNRSFKKYAAAFLSAAAFVVSMPLNDCASASSGVNVNYRTAEEIAEYINSHPFENEGSKYISEPDYKNAPYSPGVLDEETLTLSLNALNTVRFIAGIDEVELSDKYNELAQAGALVNAVNNKLSHTPEQPSGMPDELYQKGYTGTSSSNIAWTSYKASISSRLIYGWMSDADSGNIDRIGHRRWCLNPSMEKTGFGHVGNYYAMYAFDNSFGNTKYSGVCWPAQIMPEGFFGQGDPWSFSVGKEIDPSSVKVTLKRKNDDKIWEFSSSSANGYFNVENSGYGKPGCIIFRPDNISYETGDGFEVSITGLNEPVSYTVDFVDVFGSQPKITIASLVELNNFIVKRSYNADEVKDFNGDGNINVLDSVYVRRILLK